MTEDEAEAAWIACGPMLERALSYQPFEGYKLADVKAEIDQGVAHFWRWPREASEPPVACAVTNFVIYPRLKALNYWLLAGDMHALRDMLPLVEHWGHMQGCTAFMGEGRPGWARAFAEDGYEAVATLYLKAIPMGRLQ